MRRFFCDFERTAWQDSGTAEVGPHPAAGGEARAGAQLADVSPDAQSAASAGGGAPGSSAASPAKIFPKVPRVVRLASHDLLVALDNALRSVGLSFAHFSPAPRKAQ